MKNKTNGKDNKKTQILTNQLIDLDNDGHKSKPLHFFIQPNIGLDSDVRLSIVKLLNISLANESVLTQMTRNARWNMSGTGFFDLYILFDTQYKQLNEISEKIAERVRMLGGTSIGSFTEFLSHSQLEEQPTIIPDSLHLLAGHETIIRFLRESIRKCNEEFEDEGTVELLVGQMTLHEKMAWMLRAYSENLMINIESQKPTQ